MNILYLFLINKNRNGEKSPYLKDCILTLHQNIFSDNIYLLSLRFYISEVAPRLPDAALKLNHCCHQGCPEVALRLP